MHIATVGDGAITKEYICAKIMSGIYIRSLVLLAIE